MFFYHLEPHLIAMRAEIKKGNNAFLFVICLDAKETISIFAPAFGRKISLFLPNAKKTERSLRYLHTRFFRQNRVQGSG